MARLTILRASQQGFGSTLTIHRHIKEGALPVYEEGDAKLLEVDDLISLLGEPADGGHAVHDEPAGAASGAVAVHNEPTAPAADQIDIYEYNRMKSELDQKNKKNMWLAADLAEVVRELKEKEAKFDAERDRLLKVLEQAQTLLLREGKRMGSGVNNDDMSALEPDQLATNGDAGHSGEAHTTAPARDAESHDAKTGPETAISEPSAEPNNDVPTLTAHDEARPTKRTRSRISVNPANPLVPPFEDADEEPEKSRLLGRTTWIILLVLLTLVSCGVVVFQFRTQIMSSVENIMKTIIGV